MKQVLKEILRKEIVNGGGLYINFTEQGLNINLSNQGFSDSDISELGELFKDENVTSLDFTRNNIGDEGVELTMILFPNLIKLYLSQNNVSNKGALPLIRSSTLKYLDLSDNNVKEEGIALLKEKFKEGLLTHGNPGIENNELFDNINLDRIVGGHVPIKKSSVEIIHNSPLPTPETSLNSYSYFKPKSSPKTEGKTRATQPPQVPFSASPAKKSPKLESAKQLILELSAEEQDSLKEYIEYLESLRLQHSNKPAALPRPVSTS